MVIAYTLSAGIALIACITIGAVHLITHPAWSWLWVAAPAFVLNGAFTGQMATDLFLTRKRT